MHRPHLQCGLLVLFMLFLAGCGGRDTAPVLEAQPGEAPGKELERTAISMRLQWVPQWQFAGYIVAKEKGYYDEAGLDVTLQPGGPDFPAKQLVASGTDQFGIAWADSMYLSRQQEVNLVSLATLFQTSPLAYMVHADSGIDDPTDFVGKQVAVFYGGGVETEYRAMLKAAGVDREQIREVPGTYSMEPFLSRRVDVWPVYTTDQPDTVRRAGADIQLIAARDYGVVMMGDVLFATEEFIAQHPNTVQAFVSATLRGWEWAIDNKDAAVDLVAAYNPQLDREHLAFEAEETIKLLTYGVGARCVGWNDPAAWETEQQMLLDMEILKAPLPMDAVANNTFVGTYYREKGVRCFDE